jgi:hypothetical protein
MGFSMITFICFNLGSNMGSIMFGEIKKIFLCLRLKYYKWKLLKIKLFLKEKHEAALKDK